MTDFEILSLIIQTSVLIVSILSYQSNKKDRPSDKS